MERIQIVLETQINTYVVSLPQLVTLEALRGWGSEFLKELDSQSEKFALIFDTNAHNFESIECLKWLKEFFTKETIVKDHINRVTFVQPEEYRSPEVISESEAYFVNVEDARKWLQ